MAVLLLERRFGAPAPSVWYSDLGLTLTGGSMPDECRSPDTKHIFISYRHIEPDQTVARLIASAMKSAHEVFIDTDILPGADWGRSIDGALDKCDFLIVLISESGAESPMLLGEVEKAHARRISAGRPTIIPIRLAHDKMLRYPLSAYLNPFQFIRWEGPQDDERLVAALLAVVDTEGRALNGAAAPAKREDRAAERLQGKWPLDAAHARRNRLQMIKRVRFDWIDSVLNQPLYRTGRVDVRLENASDSVERPFDVILHRPYVEPQPMPSNMPIEAIFDEQLGQLLILGAPGSGKTTLLLELTQVLLNRAETDDEHPLPVVFNLSSWAVDRRLLDDWLIEELARRYDVPRLMARDWVRDERILPLLDGLDEVAAQHRDTCAECINEFRKGHGTLPVVVCSRTAEYDALATRLRLPGAIVAQTLSPEQVNEYLERAGRSLSGLNAAVRTNRSLLGLLNTPLMLSIAALAYRHSETRPEPDIGAAPNRLFDVYVDAMFHRGAKQTRYTKEKTLSWLAWLARTLIRENQTIFNLEDLRTSWLACHGQPRKLTSGAAVTTAAVGVLLVSALCWIGFGLMSAGVSNGILLLVGFTGSLIAGFAGYLSTVRDALRPMEALQFSWPVFWHSLVGPRRALWVGAALIVAGPIVAFSVGVLQGIAGDWLGLVSASGLGLGLMSAVLAWLFGGLKQWLVPSLVGMLIGAVMGWLTRGWSNALGMGIALGAVGRFVGVLDTALHATEIRIRSFPNEGVRRSLQSAIRALAILVVAGGVMITAGGMIAAWFGGGFWDDLNVALQVGLLVWMIGAVTVALQKGGNYCITHALTRLRLSYGPETGSV